MLTGVSGQFDAIYGTVMQLGGGLSCNDFVAGAVNGELWTCGVFFGRSYRAKASFLVSRLSLERCCGAMRIMMCRFLGKHIVDLQVHVFAAGAELCVPPRTLSHMCALTYLLFFSCVCSVL